MLIAVICISSGAFAILSNQPSDNMNENNTFNYDSFEGDVKDINSSESIFNIIRKNMDDYWQYTYGYLVNVDGELRHYINHNGAYYLESEGLVDRYIQCIECGGWIPIGHITNPLPKAAVCHYNDMNSNSYFSGYSQFSISRDEAYNFWVERNKPVYDYAHLNNFSNYDDKYITAIHCNDCGGSVFLKNFDESKIYNSYFTKGLHFVSIGKTSLAHDKLCSHYNGSLDIFNTPVEDFHPGWFESIDAYNHWLEEANKSLNENNAPIDDTVAPIENNDFTPVDSLEDSSNNTIKT